MLMCNICQSLCRKDISSLCQQETKQPSLILIWRQLIQVINKIIIRKILSNLYQLSKHILFSVNYYISALKSISSYHTNCCISGRNNKGVFSLRLSKLRISSKRTADHRDNRQWQNDIAGQPVFAEHLYTCILCMWLKKHTNVYLTANNGGRFDFHVLMSALMNSVWSVSWGLLTVFMFSRKPILHSHYVNRRIKRELFCIQIIYFKLP